jgi:CheY-like chemotaxis protein
MPKNLLVADDSVTIQKVVAITFANEDYAVSAVDNGEDAVAKARASRPDVILLDALMPRKNGYEACEAIKADPALAGVPVILLAGTFEPFDEARARAVHANAFIQKPFESQALINKVRELVEGRAPVTAPGATPLAYGAVKPEPAAAAPALPPVATPPRHFAPAPPSPIAAPAPVFARPAAPMPAAVAAPPQAPAAWSPPPAMVRSPPAGFPASGARPPQGAVPSPGVRPPPGARPPPGVFPPPGARPPPVAPLPPARVLAPPPPVTTPAMPFAPAPPPAPTRFDPFGIDEVAARSPPPPPAPPPPAAAPITLAEEDWSDVELTPSEPRRVLPAAPTATPTARAFPFPAPAPLPTTSRELAAEPVLEPQIELETDAAGFEPIELPAEEPSEPPPLAPMHEFVPLAETTGHQPAAEAEVLAIDVPAPPAALALEVAPASPAPPVAPVPPADGGEAVLREALSRASREVIERVVWEVVPQLAETIIRENLDRLVKARQG